MYYISPSSVFLHDKERPFEGFLATTSVQKQRPAASFANGKHVVIASHKSQLYFGTLFRIKRDSMHWQEFSVYGLARSGRLNSCPLK